MPEVYNPKKKKKKRKKERMHKMVNEYTERN